MQLPVYLDYFATTPVDPRVAEAMSACLTLDGCFGNPASRSHLYGWQAEEAVENARVELAELIGAEAREIVWTSGATESDNLALKGIVAAHAHKGRHIVISSIEHKAILDTAQWLEHQGVEVTRVAPGRDGLVSAEAVAQALREDTILVSVMHVNNELGTINDLAAIGSLCRERGVLFHSDAAQSVGKIPVDVAALNVDLLSISGHKMYGPKGVGALFVKRQPRIQLEAQIHGGGHERGMRSGTLPTHQIVGIGTAARIAASQMDDDHARISALRDRLWHGISGLPDVYLNGHETARIAGALNVAFSGLEGETLIMAMKDLAVSSGSACASASLEPSYVLRAIGLTDNDAHASIRFSLGRYTTEEQVDFAIAQISTAVSRLRAVA